MKSFLMMILLCSSINCFADRDGIEMAIAQDSLEIAKKRLEEYIETIDRFDLNAIAVGAEYASSKYYELAQLEYIHENYQESHRLLERAKQITPDIPDRFELETALLAKLPKVREKPSGFWKGFMALIPFLPLVAVALASHEHGEGS